MGIKISFLHKKQLIFTKKYDILHKQNARQFVVQVVKACACTVVNGFA